MFTMIFDILKSNGISTYFVGQHRGECLKPYVVVKDAGLSAIHGLSLDRSIIDIILFYPFGQFSRFEEYSERVKDVLRGINSMQDARYRSPVIIDEEKKAYTTTMRYWQYRAYKK